MKPDELFQHHPFLAALPGAAMQDLTKQALRKRVSPGDVVFFKGDPGDGLYGVLKGRIVVTVESEGGKELIVNTFGPGDLFGEIALLDGKGRTATALAREESELIFLGRSNFLAFLQRRPEAAAQLIAFLCERLRRTTEMFEDSVFLNVPIRLAKQLAVLADHYGKRDPASAAVTVTISQQELAQMLGVSREIVSRQLAIWRSAGMIQIGRGSLIIRDKRALDDVVSSSSLS